MLFPPSITAPAPALAVLVQDTIQRSIPFITTEDGDVFVIPSEDSPAAPGFHEAMQDLIDSGVLRSYRYIDSKPRPVVLAVTARG